MCFQMCVSVDEGLAFLGLKIISCKMKKIYISVLVHLILVLLPNQHSGYSKSYGGGMRHKQGQVV